MSCLHTLSLFTYLCDSTIRHAVRSQGIRTRQRLLQSQLTDRLLHSLRQDHVLNSFLYIYIFLPNFVTHLSITRCHFFFAFANPVYHLCQLALPTPVLGEPRLQPCCIRVMTRQPAASYHMTGSVGGSHYPP